jgi:hypothetical protein
MLTKDATLVPQNLQHPAPEPMYKLRLCRFETAKEAKATKAPQAAAVRKPRASPRAVAPTPAAAATAAVTVRAPVVKRGIAVPLTPAVAQTQAPTAMPDAAAVGASAPDALPMPLPTLPTDSATKESARVVPAEDVAPKRTSELETSAAAAAPETDLPYALPLELVAGAPSGAAAAVEVAVAKAMPADAQVEPTWAGHRGSAAVHQALMTAVTEGVIGQHYTLWCSFCGRTTYFLLRGSLLTVSTISRVVVIHLNQP